MAVRYGARMDSLAELFANISFPFLAQDGFERLFGLEVLELGEERARARVIVRDELKQPAGLVHGGVYAAIAESLPSWATALVVVPQGQLAFGLSNQTVFLCPMSK